MKSRGNHYVIRFPENFRHDLLTVISSGGARGELGNMFPRSFQDRFSMSKFEGGM